jgi:hypothetical protein
MTYFILLACTAAFELLVLRRLRFGWFIVATVLAGTLVDVSYLSYTSIFERNYDSPSHMLYIDALAEHLRPPTDVLCTACGHPPLYHALAALWSRTVLVPSLIPRELGLQWLSLLLFFGFVVFSLLLLRSTIERPAILRLAAALVVFWPSSIINSVRVHNDALASALMIAAMYFLVQWDRHGRGRDFYLAAATTALALLTKSTGYAMVMALLAALAWRLGSTRFDRECIKQGAVAALLLLGAALLAIALRGPLRPFALCPKVLGHACAVPPGFFAGNEPANYLHVDLRGFVASTSSLASDPQREYFLNVLAKSSLFGVMPLGQDFDGAPYKILAVLISVLLLAMVAVCAAVLPFVRAVRWRHYRALLFATASMLVLLVAFRMLVPTPFHADFRHIFPALVPFCLLFAKVVERLGRWSGVLYKTGLAIGLLMIASSVAFFVRLP